MNDITALMATMKAAAEKATPGEWWSDVVETDGEYGEGDDRFSGYHSFAVYVGSESLLDMTNSTAACIHEEWDHDYHMAWDETAKRNAEFIAVASPDNVKTLVEALESGDTENERMARDLISRNGEIEGLRKRVEELEESHAQVIQTRDYYKRMVEEGLKRIQESRTVTVKLRDINEYLAEVHDKTLALTFRRLAEAVRDGDVAAMRAAGIQVIEGEA